MAYKLKEYSNERVSAWKCCDCKRHPRGGNELIKESNEMIPGGDPKLEKFAKLLENHLKALPVLGALTSLWFFSLQEMTKEENLERVKKGLGRRFPIGLVSCQPSSVG